MGPAKASRSPSDELTAEEAAEYCGLAYNTLRMYLSRGKGPARTKRFGRNTFLVRDLDEWIKANTRHVPAGAPEPTEGDEVVTTDPAVLKAARHKKRPDPASKRGRATAK